MSLKINELVKYVVGITFETNFVSKQYKQVKTVISMQLRYITIGIHQTNLIDINYFYNYT
jgi:hypothetical protein